jgi:hypothetical protein
MSTVKELTYIFLKPFFLFDHDAFERNLILVVPKNIMAVYVIT